MPILDFMAFECQSNIVYKILGVAALKVEKTITFAHFGG